MTGQGIITGQGMITGYTWAVVIQVLMIGVLISCLLIGGVVIVSLALMSKREEDRTGERNPSDIGILQDVCWPQNPTRPAKLPAAEADPSDEAA
jgi:hypothetical protein